MLVIISDLHLSDGTCGTTVSPGAFEVFGRRLKDMAFGASWRMDDTYRPLAGIDILLLGDILDLIRSNRWLVNERVRPWSNPHAPEYVDMVAGITADILARNDRSFAELRRLVNSVTLPPANARKQPASGTQEQPVPVRIHYLVGNHDWFFHLNGPSYDTVRRAVVLSLGLCHRHDRPFAHDPQESDELLDVLRRHKVFARHGDKYDPFNYEGDRSASSLGDCIVIELVNRFAVEVERTLGEDLPVHTLAGLREIDNIRPSLLIPVWIEGILERSCPHAALRREVKRVWDKLADRFLQLDFVRQRDTWNPNDLVDGLQRALKFSQKLPLNWAGQVVTWLNSLRGSEGDSYYHHALNEQDFRNRRARSIVYGHTHHAECVPLDASYADGYVLNQVYFNSGTWRRVHRPTTFAPTEHEFVASDELTMLAFFQGDERNGRPFETWNGTLGIAPAGSVHRVDPGRVVDASNQSIPAPAVHGPAPHFSTAAGRAAIVPSRRQ